MDETLFTRAGRWRYAFRAIDQHGQIVDVLLSDPRDAASAQAFFAQARPPPRSRPAPSSPPKATWYPPALRAVLPPAAHRSSHYLNNQVERDQQHLTGRVRPPRRFKQTAAAGTFCQGHALIGNGGQGVADLTAAVSPRLRLATAWPALAAAP